MEVKATRLAGILGVMLACTPHDELAPELDELYLPTGLAVTPDGTALFVTNGAWDRADDTSTLMAIDLVRLERAIVDAGTGGSRQGCELPVDTEIITCDPTTFVWSDQTVRIGRGAGNIAIDTPSASEGILRLLVPTRIDTSVAWIDVGRDDAGRLELDCGQPGDRRCDDVHTMSVDAQPAILAVDRFGYRVAYLPHLLGGRLSILSLDGAFGPELRDSDPEFFSPDPIHDSELAGGFAVAQRACDVESGNAPAPTNDCSRPYLYASQRFWWGLRAFRVLPGRDRISAGGQVQVLGTSVPQAKPRPLIGDIEFADPDRGERLLVVHTTPPALALLDTSLDDEANTNNDIVTSVAVCENPNMLEVHHPNAWPSMAFVSCFGAAEVVAVDLPTFSVLAHIDVGDGANEMAVDAQRSWLFVANTQESTISIVDLRPTSSRYLRELAVLGVRGDTR